MKQRIACMALLLGAWSPGNAAIPAVTKDGYAACQTERWLDEFIGFAVAKDKESIDAYVRSQKCIWLKAGVQVTIVDAGFTKHQFAFNGVKLWTVSEALRRSR